MLLCLVASGGGGVQRRLRPELAEPAVRRGWRLAVTLTPTAAAWLDAGHVATLRAAGVVVSDAEPDRPWQPLLDEIAQAGAGADRPAGTARDR